MAKAEHEAQYLVLGDSAHPYLLARVRWPDVAQAISEDRPGWLDDPGLFDLPYDPAGERVSRGGRRRSPPSGAPNSPSSGYRVLRPTARQIPATWSDMVPVEKRSWSLEHVTTVHPPESSPHAQVLRIPPAPPTATGGPGAGMSDTRLTRPDTEGVRPPAPKHAPPDSDGAWRVLSVAPTIQPRLTPPRHASRDLQPPDTSHLGNDYRLRGLDLGSGAVCPRWRRRSRGCAVGIARRPSGVGPEPVSGASAG